MGHWTRENIDDQTGRIAIVTGSNSGIGYEAAHPGWTGTQLQRHSGVFEALNPIFAMKPWQGALPTLFAATAEEAVGGGYYGPKGFYEMRGYPGQVGSNDESRDEPTARRLWEVSEDLTGIKFDVEGASA